MTLYTKKKKNKKIEVYRDPIEKFCIIQIFPYMMVTVLTALFGAIYEKYSHEVYSYYMIYAFMIPLMLGILPSFILEIFLKKEVPSVINRIWNCGVATLTIGSLFKGVLEIYGTTNRLVIVYPIAGGVLFLLAIIFGFLLPLLNKEK